MTIKPGDWVLISEEGMLGGKVARVASVSEDGECYVRGDGFGWKYHTSDLTITDPPTLEPWLDENYATNTDGFLAAYQKDDNTFWRVDTGHLQNVIDELIERLAADERDALVMLDSHVAALAAAEQRIVAMQQILDVLGAQENVPAMIELAIKANDLMYANGQRDEAAKHHANQCCRVCDTHVNPNRGCILR
jgi:hypothetical protein